MVFTQKQKINHALNVLAINTRIAVDVILKHKALLPERLIHMADHTLPEATISSHMLFKELEKYQPEPPSSDNFLNQAIINEAKRIMLDGLRSVYICLKGIISADSNAYMGFCSNVDKIMDHPDKLMDMYMYAVVAEETEIPKGTLRPMTPRIIYNDNNIQVSRHVYSADKMVYAIHDHKTNLMHFRKFSPLHQWEWFVSFKTHTTEITPYDMAIILSLIIYPIGYEY